MKGLNIILLAIWLIVTGLVTLLKLSFSGMGIILAILEIAAGIFLIIGDKKNKVFSKLVSIVLAVWLIAMGVIFIFEITFSSMEIILGILAIAAGVLIVITTKKGQLGKNLGALLLAIWLIVTGLVGVIELSFSALPIILAILAIASGILLLLKK